MSDTSGSKTNTHVRRSTSAPRKKPRTVAEKLRNRGLKREVMLEGKTALMAKELAATDDARDIKVAQIADEVFSRGASYLRSASNIAFLPDGNPCVPELALCGRGGVGRTALLRALFKRRRPVSFANTLQRRDVINYFNVGGVFHIAETPGYGGTKVAWSAVMEHAAILRNFVRVRPSLKMTYYCMDVSPIHGVFQRDLDMLSFMSREMPNFTILLTKAEKIPTVKRSKQSHLRTMDDIREELLLKGIRHPVIATSAFTMGGIDTVRYDMVMNALHALPTEQLTITQSRALGDRLFSSSDMAAVRPVFRPPNQDDDSLSEWNQDLISDGEASKELLCKETQLVAAEAKQEAAVQRIKKTLGNEEHMRFVHRTSPWRNSLKWPKNVMPTANARVNVMKCPGAEDNPYLTQAQFAVPRMDMCFKRRTPTKNDKEKGMYLPDATIGAQARKQFTVPYFPEIHDVVNSLPKPQPYTFIGSLDKYYTNPGLRARGIRFSHEAQQDIVDPISDQPAPHVPLLTEELANLERKRYGAPIANLKPKGLRPPATTTQQQRALPPAPTTQPFLP